MPPAAASLRNLCALAREQPATVLAAMGDGNRGYDVDDLRASVADYVQAHAFLLERAGARGLSIVHVAWFY